MQDFDLIFLLKLGEKFGFAELGQCILQQIYTFMREEKLERYLRWRELNPVPHGTAKGYSKLVIENQQTAPLPGVEPGSSSTEVCQSLP